MKTIRDFLQALRYFIKKLHLLILLLLLALALAACVIPGASTPAPVSSQETPQANPAYTAAAQTIIAQLTALAPAGTVEPPTLPAAQATSTTATEQTEETQSGQPTDGGEATAEGEPAAASVTATSEPSPTPEPSLTPTSPPQPSPTPASNDPRARLGKPDWSDTFANAKNWPLTDNEYEDEHVHFRLLDGGFQLLAKKPEKWDGWILSWTTLFNFYLEVTASPQNCSGADRYGLLARAPSAEEAYLFGFTCDGQDSLRKWNGKRYTYLVDWTKSALINQGQGKTNRLGFMADGDQISLYANGELLNEISDRSYSDGAFGLFISSANTENFKVMVSEVNYWELP